MSNADRDLFERVLALKLAAPDMLSGKNFGALKVGELVLTDTGHKHPDSGLIKEWIGKRKLDDAEFNVLMWCADLVSQEWDLAPHFTNTEHRQKFSRVAELCEELQEALTATGADYAGGRGVGLCGATILSLVAADEFDPFDFIRSEGVKDYVVNADFVLLTMETLLQRLATAANRLAEEGPIHSQPRKHGAKRGYFVRRMGEIFSRRYAEQPHEVIAALTTIALGEATDRELVAKLLA